MLPPAASYFRSFMTGYISCKVHAGRLFQGCHKGPLIYRVRVLRTFLKICPRLAKHQHAVIHTPNSSTLLAGYNCHISQSLVSLSSSPLSSILPECTASKPRVQAKHLVCGYRQSVACQDSEDMQTTLLTKLEGPGLHAFYRLLLVQFRHNTPSDSLTDYGNIAEAYRQI